MHFDQNSMTIKPANKHNRLLNLQPQAKYKHFESSRSVFYGWVLCVSVFSFLKNMGKVGEEIGYYLIGGVPLGFQIIA